MRDNDREQFVEILTTLGTIHDKALTEFLITGYWNALEQFTIAQVTDAATRLLQTTKWFPKPAEFIEAIYGKTEDRAESAWTIFVEAVRRGGQMKSVYCADACLVEAIKRTFGSWIKACETLPPAENPMHASLKKTFVAAYQMCLREGATTHYLKGRSETENASNNGLQTMRLAGRESFQQDVVCITGSKITLTPAAFSTATGLLIDAQLLALPGMQPEEGARAALASQTMKLISERTM